jgi:hypothetical protein
MMWIIPGFSFFSLVTPPPSSAWSGGAFSGMGVWFPSRLPLEGTDRIENFGP